MKKRVLKIMVMVLAVAMLFVFAACSPEIIYVADFTGEGASHAGGNTTPSTPSTGGDDQPSTGGDTNPTTGDGGTYNLTVWCAEEDMEMIYGMLESYKALYPTNKYSFTVQPQGEDTVTSAVTRDVESAADVFSFANDQLGLLINGNALTQIPSTYTAQINKQIDVARIAASYNNSYYAIPYSYENCFLYYNKSLLTDVSTMEKILSANTGANFNLGIDMNDGYYTTMFLYTAGVEIFGPQGNDPSSVDLDNENAYKACQYIMDLHNQTKLVSIAKNDQSDSLRSGRVAAMISGPHMIAQFKNALGSNFGVAMLPSIRFAGESKDTQLVSFSGVKMYGVSRKTNRDSKLTAEAMRLAAYLANSENQQIRLEEREFCPTDEDLFDDALNSGIEAVEVVVNQSEYSKLKPGLIQMGKYWTPMGDFLVGVYNFNKPESTWSTELKKIEDKLKE